MFAILCTCICHLFASCTTCMRIKGVGCSLAPLCLQVQTCARVHVSEAILSTQTNAFSRWHPSTSQPFSFWTTSYSLRHLLLKINLPRRKLSCSYCIGINVLSVCMNGGSIYYVQDSVAGYIISFVHFLSLSTEAGSKSRQEQCPRSSSVSYARAKVR